MCGGCDDPDEHRPDRRPARGASEYGAVSPGHADRASTGRICPSDRSRPGRPPLLFRAVRGMDPTGPRRYRLLAEVLTHSLANGPNPGALAIEAGGPGGRRLASLTADDGDAAGDGAHHPAAGLAARRSGLHARAPGRGRGGWHRSDCDTARSSNWPRPGLQGVCPVHGPDVRGHGRLGRPAHRGSARGVRRARPVPGPPRPDEERSDERRTTVAPAVASPASWPSWRWSAQQGSPVSRRPSRPLAALPPGPGTPGTRTGGGRASRRLDPPTNAQP